MEKSQKEGAGALEGGAHFTCCLWAWWRVRQVCQVACWFVTYVSPDQLTRARGLDILHVSLGLHSLLSGNLDWLMMMEGEAPGPNAPHPHAGPGPGGSLSTGADFLLTACLSSGPRVSAGAPPPPPLPQGPQIEWHCPCETCVSGP